MSSEPRSRAGKIVNSVFERLQRGDLDALLALYTPACTFVDMASGETSSGTDALRLLLVDYWTGLPDFRVAEAQFIEADPLVVVELVLQGTHRGTFLGYPATGRQIRWRACAVYSIDPDRNLVNTEAYYYDSQTLRDQLA
jgi:steroid delta-isomerase-like uncharacterized protein